MIEQKQSDRTNKMWQDRGYLTKYVVEQGGK